MQANLNQNMDQILLLWILLILLMKQYTVYAVCFP